MKHKVIFCVVLLLIAIIAVKYRPARMILTEVDYRYLGGSVFKLVGRDNGSIQSDIDLYKVNIDKANYEWLSDDDIMIAHGLGGSDNLINTQAAFESSLKAGFRYFEVDVVLHNNELFCSHSLAEIKHDERCKFESIISMAESHKVWFILDVKSKFDITYKKITEELQASPSHVGHQFIPQIYLFNQIKYLDLTLFSGPIFTGYRINQHGGFLQEIASNLRLPVMALPPIKLSTSSTGFKVRLFSHNINSLQEYKKLKHMGVTGFYIRERLYHEIQRNRSVDVGQ